MSNPSLLLLLDGGGYQQSEEYVSETAPLRSYSVKFFLSPFTCCRAWYSYNVKFPLSPVAPGRSQVFGLDTSILVCTTSLCKSAPLDLLAWLRKGKLLQCFFSVGPKEWSSGPQLFEIFFSLPCMSQKCHGLNRNLFFCRLSFSGVQSVEHMM